ncbi:unnamed protein product, partial [Mesorhabditis belari]|uniref:Uncharacterized protein n=1 Tax=Mesorhabditis belari TaxID=2138241 RepID=A0AAF3FD57_9BILA
MGLVRISITLLLVAQCLVVASPGIESRQAAVNRAIEQTKRRQSAPPATQNTRASTRNTAGGRSETVDVERLNSLLRTLDKTWVLPRVGAKEPVGSNFQYKKTCASIYKARHGACQQLGFGTMCFNYCNERGEKLVFKCQDTSEASYCRQSATFDIFIAKYRKDAYKAKAYVHQMISRCFATAICNTQTGILNSTLIEEDFQPETTTKVPRLRITKPAGGFVLPGKSGRNKPKEEEISYPGRPVKQRKYKPTTTIALPEPEFPVEEVEEEPQEEIVQVVETVATTRLPARRTTTQKANIWDKFTLSAKGKATPKYIPFWQKLLTTPSPTRTRVEESAEVANEEEPQNVTEPELPVEEVEKTTKFVTQAEKERTTQAPIVEKIVDPSTEAPAEEEIEEETTITQKIATTTTTSRPPKQRGTTRSRHTFKPLPVTPQGPDLAFMKPGDPNSAEQLPGFWNKFQPGRWYQSIHYLTNTGR